MTYEIFSYVWGLSLCIYKCLMNESNSLDESGRRTGILYPVCLNKLQPIRIRSKRKMWAILNAKKLRKQLFS
ncbi:unnamed protein product [Blepharisma stoltei]|uniref:Uncharacterized protein n=1 Tax=Blepharisma stoltei TaxID=1481888 RepID=A0AAU9IZW8_9CILI|nr:unnamed protein product [Blepharisma stoltei]